jgi:predicted metal-dependent hydrolase
MDTPPDYDPRYLAGILFFNQQDYFEAHEVWEDLWMASSGPVRQFYKALIHAAVALHHFSNGNLRGAIKLFRSGHDYMQAHGDRYLGLDVPAFWQQMEHCFAEVLSSPNPDRNLRPEPDRLPIITLDPAPPSWPNPEDFLEDEDQSA